MPHPAQKAAAINAVTTALGEIGRVIKPQVIKRSSALLLLLPDYVVAKRCVVLANKGGSRYPAAPSGVNEPLLSSTLTVLSEQDVNDAHVAAPTAGHVIRDGAALRFAV